MANYASNINIFNNNITKNDEGIMLYSSSDNNVSSNRIAENNFYGIYLWNSSKDSISTNSIANNWGGIMLWYSVSVNVTGNSIASNNGLGIGVSDSSLNIIANNNLTNNEYGVQLSDSSNNTVTGNTVANNEHGVAAYSPNNKFYHNNFVNNTNQVTTLISTVNSWDDGYPSGGNYWSDYNGTDLHWGSGQNETGSDGIGDVVYEIDADNRDRYPLMAPFNTFDAGVWNGVAYNVDVVSNSTLSNFQLNTTLKTISFNVTGVEDTAGFCRVTIPNIIVQDLWQGNYTVLLNGEPWSFRNWTDTTNTYIYVNYTYSEHQIIIIPEFPSAIILPLFMVLSVIVLVLAKKKRLKKTQT